MKYFAVQVQTSKEESYISRVNTMLEFRSDCQRFIFLKRQLPIRRGGKTENEMKPVFPGYIFVQADSVDAELFNIMRSTKNFLRFLQTNKNIVPLQHNDLALLEHFMRLGGVAEISTVTFDENDRIVIKSGPLKGLEGSIVSVNRRKKRAKIALDLSNQKFLIDLAFNILEERINE
ncbi:MAG: antiterminator LoaP [Spirochaetales bacterium]